MTLCDIQEKLGCRVECRNEWFDKTAVGFLVAGDLMSDVLVADKDDLVLITSLTTDQVARTAHMVDALGIILVNGKRPQESMRELAEDLEMSILSTELSMFECCVTLDKLFS